MSAANIREAVRTVSLPDGRRIAFHTFGAERGRPVIALHGTPGSRLKFAMADGVARDRGLLLVSIDRWGYGLSDPHPRPSLRAFGDDIAHFLDATGIDRIGVLGVSGGGPYAAAVAARLGARISALALVAPVGPIAGEVGLALSPFHTLAFRGLARTPGAMRGAFAAFRALLRRDAALAMRIASARSAPVDRSTVCRPFERQSLVDAFKAGLEPGARGPAIDMALFGKRWDIDFAGIGAPARLWIGDADRHVPVAAARLLGARIGGCATVDLVGAGHYWVMQNMDEVLGWLSETMGQHNTAPGK